MNDFKRAGNRYAILWVRISGIRSSLYKKLKVIIYLMSRTVMCETAVALASVVRIRSLKFAAAN